MTMPDPVPGRSVSDRPWPLWRLGLLLYPFTVMAVWINLFMAGLLLTWVDMQNIPASRALFLALFVGLPVTWLAARWLRRLLDRAAED
ncbi:MAG: hypothetical protein Q4G25_13350 [Paracoccus sp. (in: a-proteobacteria)]|nr:hypothetical protein [Paracoccus sp. (in: a-proteobacteria)]